MNATTTTVKKQPTKVSHKDFVMLIESKGLNLVSIAKKNTPKALKPTLTVEEMEILKQSKKEEQAQKRALNPTITKLVGEQKRADEIEFKSNAKAVLISTKNRLKKVMLKDLTIYENETFVKKCNTLVNYITSPKNASQLDLFLTFAKTSKNGFFSESNFSSLIQQITKISILKNKDFNESLNYFEALKKAKK